MSNEIEDKCTTYRIWCFYSHASSLSNGKSLTAKACLIHISVPFLVRALAQFVGSIKYKVIDI